MVFRPTLAVLLVLWLSVPGFSQTTDEPKTESDKQPTANDQVARWLRQMDRNSDGKIAEAESAGLMKRFFARNDSNKDGFLDGKELAALSKRLQENARRRNNSAAQNPRNEQTLSTEALLRRAPEGVLIEPDISYREGKSEAWKLDLVRPKAKGDSPRPGIVFVHGGGWSSGDKRRSMFLNGAIEYAQLGYVCITINYRLTGEAPFPACVEDVKCAVRWFRAHAKKYNLDPKRIGGFGNSAGAHLVSMLGLVKADAKLEGDGPWQDQSSMLLAVCASATPTDFLLNGEPKNINARSAFGRLLPGKDSIVERAKKASPISYVAKDAPPFLLFHGTADKTVDVKHSDRFVEALKKAGADDVTYLRIDDAGHGVFNQHRKETHPVMRKFFERTIGTAAAKGSSK